ncbi:sensor histidine kinase [Streptomyces sp. MP131-18]|uniref:sensor histidine kinase n=1 Tax=Streptomyces sp. MP131-18 TaxID=1857892 RepID=UPI00097C16FF|nr:sensor histidine kinase [Streptomyces sp. MP131-18]ONK13430.1 Sensor histidine kinase DesK [Streptomyces sp. MP131-18]
MFASFAQVFRSDRAVQLAALVLLGDIGMLFFFAESGWGVAVGGRVLIFLGWLALVLRHRWPVPVAAVILLINIAFFPLSHVDGSAPMVCFVIALYSAARAGYMTAVAALVVVAMLFIGYGEFVMAHEDGRREVDNMAIALISGWFLSVIAFGHAMRVRAAYLHETEQRVLAAERERDVRARQSATEERLRIARELHDVLGHSISLINVQAAAAVHRSAKRPGQTEELLGALEFVRETSKEALRELRATLGVLRAVDEGVPTVPAPAGLERIGELADRAAATGLDVAFESTGEPPVVPPQISLAAYRIIQESLTNITRHAQATSAAIRVAFAPGELRVEVTDDGRGADPGPDTQGSGIAGMRERARALGGELTAANAGPGFRVAARLPLPAAPGATPTLSGAAASAREVPRS